MAKQNLKLLIKNLLPKQVFKILRPYYHGALALMAHFFYGRPSNHLIVIGVTGTNGKTTTVNLIAKILENAGHRVGLFSTINYNFDGSERANDYKMTMPSGWILQRGLSQMVNFKFEYAVIEVSSEGLAQNRHLGINFDYAIFTNLTPEHLESHGGFENYKAAKGSLFKSLNQHSLTKQKLNINPALKKTIIVNSDDEHADYYLNFPASNRIRFAVNNQAAEYIASDLNFSPAGISFLALQTVFNLQLKGQFDVANALGAIATTHSLGISLQQIKTALEKIPVVPGRVEVLATKPFTVVVDYAYEPEEMRQLYETVKRWQPNSIIQILGPTGGGRDHARIKILGQMAGTCARKIFITTDDPYDNDPKTLAEEMSQGVAQSGKTLNSDYFIELDRRLAIRKAFKVANPNDLILITGKGADQKMCLANGFNLDWDDRVVAREELKAYESTN